MVVVALLLAALPGRSPAFESAAPSSVELSFVPVLAEPAFAVAGSTHAADLGDFVVLTGIGGTRSERSRVALRAPQSSDAATELPLPRPPAPSAIRSLTLAFGLLGNPTAGGPTRLGRWRLEALIADESRENEEWSPSSRSTGKRHLAVRLRGALSSRMRATLGVSRTSPPLAARPLEWSSDSLTAADMAESLEAAYDVVQNHLLGAERAASLTVSARRSQFTAPVSDPSTAFPDTDAIFAAAAERAPAVGFAFGGWQVPGPEPLVRNRVAEEIAATNLKLSLFPWLVDPAERDGWRAGLEQGFARVRPWRAGQAGAPENIHTVGAHWAIGSHRLAYRHEAAVDGEAGGRTLDELSAGSRLLPSLGLQLSAAKSARPARGDDPGFDGLDLSGAATWTPSRDWTLWSRLASGDGRCGRGCDSSFRALDLQLSRQAMIAVNGRRLPLRIQGGGSAQRLASSAGLDETAELHWSLQAGVSMTF